LPLRNGEKPSPRSRGRQPRIVSSVTIAERPQLRNAERSWPRGHPNSSSGAGTTAERLPFPAHSVPSQRRLGSRPSKARGGRQRCGATARSASKCARSSAPMGDRSRRASSLLPKSSIDRSHSTRTIPQQARPRITLRLLTGESWPSETTCPSPPARARAMRPGLLSVCPRRRRGK
jgi:hypothetical protein